MVKYWIALSFWESKKYVVVDDDDNDNDNNDNNDDDNNNNDDDDSESDTWGSFAAFSRNTSLLSKTIRFTCKYDGDVDGDDNDKHNDNDDDADFFSYLRPSGKNVKFAFFLKHPKYVCSQIGSSRFSWNFQDWLLPLKQVEEFCEWTFQNQQLNAKRWWCHRHIGFM